MRFSELHENPEVELRKRLPSLHKHDYTVIDDLVRKVARKHKITHKALEDLFKRNLNLLLFLFFIGISEPL